MLNRLREEWAWAQDEAHFSGEKFRWWEFLAYHIRDLFNEEACHVAGHKWVDDSHAGPDSGNMSVTCTRCGYNHSTTLY